jgi:DNA repair ATPase RecN
MLKSIFIKNFAIIDELELDFYDGMSVLTGETGAGKSIIIDALNLALGNRADRSVARTENENVEVVATIDASSSNEAILIKTASVMMMILMMIMNVFYDASSIKTGNPKHI